MKFLAFSLLIFPMHLFCCTGIYLKASDNSIVNGRTIEFGTSLDMSIAVIPRNYTFLQKTSSFEAMSYQSVYAAAGVYCFDEPVLIDGINEVGLSVGAFYFSTYAKYCKLTQKNSKHALSPIDFSNWVLTNFATIEEVKEAIKSVVISADILLPGAVLKDWKGGQPPLHYVVYDKFGKCIVIEPFGDTLNVYDNKLGVITNSPSFDFHLTNLNNYINLNSKNVETNKIGDYSLKSFGQGSGMLGLPGDFTSPSRFIRAAFFSAQALTPYNCSQAVDQTFHILNQFDIPKGSVSEEIRGKTYYDFTMLTTVKDTKNLEYFFKSYKNQATQFIKLDTFDFNSKTIKTMKIDGEQEKIDVSSKLQ
jgi:choloylglycine hydrolase